jgi:hypothetical protein
MEDNVPADSGGQVICAMKVGSIEKQTSSQRSFFVSVTSSGSQMIIFSILIGSLIILFHGYPLFRWVFNRYRKKKKANNFKK